MIALHGRVTRTIFLLACGLCAVGSMPAEAQTVNPTSENDGKCTTEGRPIVDALNGPQWNGWGVNSSQRRFQTAIMAQLAATDVPRLRLKWAFGYPNAVRAFAQPTIVAGRLFVGSQSGTVYSLDANNGCTYWEFDAGKPVRSTIIIGPRTGGWSAYFGDLGANVYAVDVLTGKQLWKTRLDDHPAARVTGSPVLVGPTLFVPVSSSEEAVGANPTYSCCSFRGSLVALDASTGKLQWKSHTIREEPRSTGTSPAGVELRGPSGAAIWSSPTYDSLTRRVYVTTGDNYSDPPTDTSDAILAYDAGIGELVWSRQITAGDAYNLACVRGNPANCPEANGPDYDFGSSALLVDLQGGKRALIGTQKSGVVTAVDPDRRGEILWQQRVGNGGKLGGVQWGAAADESKLYVAVSDVKPVRVDPSTPGAQLSLGNSEIAFLLDNRVGGGLHALNLETGDKIWQTAHPGCNDVPGCSPAQSAAVTAIPGIVFSGGLDGHLRAYSAEDGRIVWDVDTKIEYSTVNGIPAHGGSIDGPGPVVVGGTVYVNSGYRFFGTQPGNALLAYSVEGR